MEHVYNLVSYKYNYYFTYNCCGRAYNLHWIYIYEIISDGTLLANTASTVIQMSQTEVFFDLYIKFPHNRYWIRFVSCVRKLREKKRCWCRLFVGNFFFSCIPAFSRLVVTKQRPRYRYRRTRASETELYPQTTKRYMAKLKVRIQGDSQFQPKWRTAQNIYVVDFVKKPNLLLFQNSFNKNVLYFFTV